MEKRVLLAVILSVAVMYGYSLIFPPAKPPTTAPAGPAQGSVSSAARLTAQPAAAPVPAVAPILPATPAAAAAQEVTVETDLYRAVFTSQGAALTRFVLKNYRDVPGTAGKPVVLVQESRPERASLRVAAPGFGLDPGALYAVSQPSLTLSGGQQGALTFTTVTPTGEQVRKVFSFVGNSYGIGLDLQVANGTVQPRSGELVISLVNRAGDGKEQGQFDVLGPVTLAGDKLDNVPVKDLAKGEKSYAKDILWTGFGDKYFLSALLKGGAAGTGSDIGGVRVTKEEGYVLTRIATVPASVAPGQSVSLPFRLFFGPKDLHVLKVQGEQLEKALDLGWFSALAMPLLQSLNFFYRYIPNYGIAIIIITVILKILFFPLTHKSYKSMKEMQKLQPKMQQLKEKHKNDRDAMNREVMELYKTHKVNPLGGCLPMVVQIPVFFALYKALMYSIELRHAPFYGWITDLAAKDPYYVTPILMGASMVIQQKMTPSAGMDPMQQKMMMALPVVFTFMFLNFPSGLVLYWLVNNILTIAQQLYINKSVNVEPPAAPALAGGGKKR